MNKYLEKIKTKKAVIGIIGMGYVGLPLARAFSFNDFKVIGFGVSSRGHHQSGSAVVEGGRVTSGHAPTFAKDSSQSF